MVADLHPINCFCDFCCIEYEIRRGRRIADAITRAVSPSDDSQPDPGRPDSQGATATEEAHTLAEDAVTEIHEDIASDQYPWRGASRADPIGMVPSKFSNPRRTPLRFGIDMIVLALLCIVVPLSYLFSRKRNDG